MRDIGGRPPHALCGRSQSQCSMKAGRAFALPARGRAEKTTRFAGRGRFVVSALDARPPSVRHRRAARVPAGGFHDSDPHRHRGRFRIDESDANRSRQCAIVPRIGCGQSEIAARHRICCNKGVRGQKFLVCRKNSSERQFTATEKGRYATNLFIMRRIFSANRKRVRHSRKKFPQCAENRANLRPCAASDSRGCVWRAGKRLRRHEPAP